MKPTDNTTTTESDDQQSGFGGVDGAICSPDAYDTPETDDQYMECRGHHCCVPADFARRLERERNEARKALETLAEKCSKECFELMDGAYDIIEMWKAQSPSQIAWKKSWLTKARELGANPSW